MAACSIFPAALKKVSEVKRRDDLLRTYFRLCGEDKSWRVRYMVADHAQQLCEVFESQVKSSILPLFLKLLQDQEAEVRAIAAARLASVAALHPKKEFLDSLLPAIEKLTMPKELSTPVRISLAGSVLNLASIFGAKLTTEHLLGI